MGKCTKCGTNFVGTPENPPVDALCKYCEIEQLKSEVVIRREKMADIVRALGRGCGGMGHDEIAPIVLQLRTDKAKLRVALVGLVGVDTAKELDGMEALMRISPVADDDRQHTITAIHALRETLPQ